MIYRKKPKQMKSPFNIILNILPNCCRNRLEEK